MATLLVGDIHGHITELERLLAKADFNSDKDTLWLTGDLVARGPDSLQVMRYVKSLGSAVRMVLGNHDLNLIGIYSGIVQDKPKNRLAKLLAAPDVDELISWLRRQPLMQIDETLQLIMVHAGLSPQWDLATAKQCAQEVEQLLCSDNYRSFLKDMYGDLPNLWSDQLQGVERLRYITNAFTRMRYCDANGALDMHYKGALKEAPAWLKPWFRLSGSIPASYHIAFGHWASLEGKHTPNRIYALDTGCCWEGYLTLLRWEDQRYFRQKAVKGGKEE